MRLLIIFLFLLAKTSTIRAQIDKRINNAIEVSKQSESIQGTLLFNQPKYFPGDTVFYKPIFFHSNIVTKRKVYAKVGIYSNSGKNLLSTTVILNGDASRFYLPIPETLTPGLYRVVASTIGLSKGSIKISETLLYVVGRNQMVNSNVKMHAEGGHVLAGQENKILIDTKGDLYDSIIVKQSNAPKQIITERKAYHILNIKAGLSSTSLEADLYQDGKKKTLDPLPIESDQLAIRLLNASLNSIEVEINGFLTERKNNFYLTLTNSSGTVSALYLNSKSGNKVNMPGPFNQGLHEISLLNESLDIISRRIVFIDHQQTCNLKISPIGSISPRDMALTKINFTQDDKNIVLSQSASQPDNQLSIRVFDKRMLDGKISEDGFSEFAIDIISRNDYLIGSENFLLSKTSLFNPVKNAYSNFFLITGKTEMREGDRPVPDSTKVNALLEENLLNFESNSIGGRFSALMPYDLQGVDRAIYTATYRGKEINIKLIPDDDFPNVGERNEALVESRVTDWYSDFAIKRNVINKAYEQIGSVQNILRSNVKDPNSKFLEELDGADVTLVLKNFKVFPNMIEVTRELLKSAEIRKIQGKDVIRIYVTQRKASTNPSPLFVIDGHPTRDINDYLNLSPPDVEYIKIIKEWPKLIRLGKLAEDGIIVVKTKGLSIKGDENGFNVVGLNPKTKMKPNKIGNLSATIPYLQSTIFWEPDMSIMGSNETTVSLQAPDNSGTFVIQALAVTSTGHCYAESELVVTNGSTSK